MSTMLNGTIDVCHFITLRVTLILAGSQKSVKAKPVRFAFVYFFLLIRMKLCVVMQSFIILLLIEILLPREINAVYSLC